MDQVEITAGRLHLRPPVLGDWPEIYAANCHLAPLLASLDAHSPHQNPEIQQWTSVPSPYSEGDAQSFVADFAPESWRTGQRATFAVCDATSGQLLGMCDLGHLGIEPDIGHVGYWCAPWARGQGVTTDAVEAVCHWGFAALGLARIEWYAEAGNVASRRVAEKAGFTYEGRLRGKLVHRGKRVDAWVAGLLGADLS